MRPGLLGGWEGGVGVHEGRAGKRRAPACAPYVPREQVSQRKGVSIDRMIRALRALDVPCGLFSFPI